MAVMAGPVDSSYVVGCSFCGKAQRDVVKLFAGPGVYSCDDCVNGCVGQMREEGIPVVGPEVGDESS